MPILAEALETEGNVAERLDKVSELEPRERGPLNEAQWVVLRYADAMTRSVKVEEALFEEVKGLGLDSQGIVELTATVASYNMVSRFLVALNVAEQVSVFSNSRSPWRWVEVLTQVQNDKGPNTHVFEDKK